MLFVDIAGFTSMCERVPPDALSGLVSQYFETMSSLVMSHSGLIDKYIGDCIMAVWGAPFAVPSKAARATLCGLRIDRETRVDPLLSAFDAEGEQLSIRVGIASGVVLAGNMGSAERMNYTVIGDAVNLASRIEGLNKALGTRVAVDDDTAAEIGTLFILRTLVNVAVVGKKDGVRVHEVVGINPNPTELDVQMLRRDEEEVDENNEKESSDAISDVTFMSDMRQLDAGAGRRIPSTQSLLDAARRQVVQPIVATPHQIDFARVFTQAVQTYIAGDFVAAKRHLAALPEQNISDPPHHATPLDPNGHGDSTADTEMQPFASGGHDHARFAGSPVAEALRAQTSLSVSLLRNLLEKVTTSPPPDMSSWDGIWVAESK